MLEIFDVMRNHPVLCADFLKRTCPVFGSLSVAIQASVSPFKPQSRNSKRQSRHSKRQSRKYLPHAAQSYHQFAHVFNQAVLSAYMRVPEFVDGLGESYFLRH